MPIYFSNFRITELENGHVRDQVAEQCQKRFQDFLDEWKDRGEEPKYLAQARELVKPEWDMLQVSMKDVKRYSGNLSTTTISDYCRLLPLVQRRQELRERSRGLWG